MYRLLVAKPQPGCHYCVTGTASHCCEHITTIEANCCLLWITISICCTILLITVLYLCYRCRKLKIEEERRMKELELFGKSKNMDGRIHNNANENKRGK
jgi:beta-lactamase regulating signal transducer with metallopeptidase domain